MSLIETLRTNTDTIIGETELEDRLHGNRPLRVKLGVDPTRPDLTFGHLVGFNKLRQLQDLGHEAILIICDVNLVKLSNMCCMLGYWLQR